jgi:RHS repeat-associated protein
VRSQERALRYPHVRAKARRLGDPARAQAKPSTDGPRNAAHQRRGRRQLRPRAQLNAAGTVTAEFVYANGINVPDAILTGGKTYALLRDHLGSVRLVVDVQTGAIAQQLAYDAFGQATQNTSPGFQPFGFAGGLDDAETGLVHLGARDYDPSVGRWISKDPVRFDGGGNLYVYATNDPVNYVDAKGESPAAAAVVAGGIYAAACAVYALRETDKYSSSDDKMKHCVASCVFNRCTALAVPWATAGAGYLWEKLQGGFGIGHDSEDDLMADFEGVSGSYDVGKSCEDVCRPHCP